MAIWRRHQRQWHGENGVISGSVASEKKKSNMASVMALMEASAAKGAEEAWQHEINGGEKQ